MRAEKNKITWWQYVFLIHGVQLGVGVFTLPRVVAEKSGTDGWIPIIIYWFLSTIASFFIIEVMKKYPDGTIVDLLEHYFGKWVGKAAMILFTIYFGLLTTVIYAREALFIQFWVLPGGQLVVIALLLAIPSFLIVRKNIVVLGRYSQLVFVFSVWMLLAYIIIMMNGQWLHLLPVLKEGWGPILKTVKTVALPFFGFEILFFIYPYLQNKEKAFLGAVTANTITMMVYLIVTIAAFVLLSPDELTVYQEPTIMMLKVLEFRFIERLEIPLFSLYLFTISTTVLPFMFLTVFCTSRLFGTQNHSRFVVFFLLFEVLYIIFFQPTFEKNTMIHQIAKKWGIAIAFALPLLLWGILLFQRRFTRGTF